MRLCLVGMSGIGKSFRAKRLAEARGFQPLRTSYLSQQEFPLIRLRW